MEDYLVKAITNDGMFRAYAINAKQVVTEAQRRHDTYKDASAALGRTMIASLMLAASVDKSGASLTVKIDGQGPLGEVVVGSDSRGNVKGYVLNPHVDLPLKSNNKIDVSKAVGVNGFLSVVKMAHNQEPYTSSVPLVSGEIGDDFTFYLAQSEQIPSAMGVSVFVNNDHSIEAAGGYLVQVLPGASEEAITNLEKQIQQLPALSDLLRKATSPEEILKLIFGDDLKFLTTSPVQFNCNCSKEKFRNDIVGLPINQLKEISEEDGQMDVVCNFCGNQYHFDHDELLDIIEEANN